MHSPTIVNQTKYCIVVFKERGILYNQQVLLPGEAVSMTQSQTTGIVPQLLPYYIHAAVGDERALPTPERSARNLVAVSAIPAAFCVAALVTAMSAGTLAGPSAALAPLVSGMVVNGVVIDAAAITAGAVAANRASVVSEMLLKQHPTKFLAKSGRLKPGKLFMTVTGGLNDGNLTIETINERQFHKLGITQFKEPIETIHHKVQYYLPAFYGNPKVKSELPQIEGPSQVEGELPQIKVELQQIEGESQVKGEVHQKKGFWQVKDYLPAFYGKPKVKSELPQIEGPSPVEGELQEIEVELQQIEGELQQIEGESQVKGGLQSTKGFWQVKGELQPQERSSPMKGKLQPKEEPQLTKALLF
jgi:copper chaperone CopZ